MGRSGCRKEISRNGCLEEATRKGSMDIVVNPGPLSFVYIIYRIMLFNSFLLQCFP